MSEVFDTIVIGLGAMGSAACYHLRRMGKKVLGIDQFSPPHSLGSSHGQTRIIREAYFEHPLYVPLVQRAYELWHELETITKRRLFLQTGGLMLGPQSGAVFRGAKRSAEEHNLAHEILSADQVRGRFPALQPSDDMAAVWEPRAGILFPEACIEAHLAQAKHLNAKIHTDEKVLRWDSTGSGVRVITNQGNYEATNLVLSAGSWLPALLPDLKLPLVIERQVLYWFEPRVNAGQFNPERCPIYIWEHAHEKFFYGFPDLGEGVKVAGHHEGEITSPDQIDRKVSPKETDAMRAILKKFLPDANGPLRSAVVCMYTDTPDLHFLIDRHPACPHVLIASPCSGHGFKFSAAVGEVLAAFVSDFPSPIDLSLFRYRW